VQPVEPPPTMTIWSSVIAQRFVQLWNARLSGRSYPDGRQNPACRGRYFPHPRS